MVSWFSRIGSQRIVAPPIGFEPMTNCLTGRRSTELSHGGRFYKHMEVHILIFDWPQAGR